MSIALCRETLARHHLEPEVRLIQGDVRDGNLWARRLGGRAARATGARSRGATPRGVTGACARDTPAMCARCARDARARVMRARVMRARARHPATRERAQRARNPGAREERAPFGSPRARLAGHHLRARRWGARGTACACMRVHARMAPGRIWARCARTAPVRARVRRARAVRAPSRSVRTRVAARCARARRPFAPHTYSSAQACGGPRRVRARTRRAFARGVFRSRGASAAGGGRVAAGAPAARSRRRLDRGSVARLRATLPSERSATRDAQISAPRAEFRPRRANPVELGPHSVEVGPKAVEFGQSRSQLDHLSGECDG